MIDARRRFRTTISADSTGHDERSRDGFTIIEMLVVMTLISLLIMLLLPAVQAARESARRSQCRNNSKQIGLAVAQYTSTFGCYPRGRQVSSDARYRHYESIPCSGPQDRSFIATILPYMEHQSVYDSLNHHLWIFSPQQSTTYGTSISIFACPTDTMAGFRKPVRLGSRFTELELPRDSVSLVFASSYAANHGSIIESAYELPRENCAISPKAAARVNGCITDLPFVTLESVTDGLSNTIIVAEKSNTILGQIRHSRSPYPYSELFGLWITGTFNDAMFTARYGPNFHERTGPNTQPLGAISASSQHPGGLHAIFGDGSVRFVKTTIDHGEGEDRPGLWQKLATRNGGEVIDASSY